MRRQIFEAARAAHPAECCGLLVGAREGQQFRIAALHPARNLSADARRFEIDPRDQVAAQRHARDQGTAVVGCYHSHPDGQALPSMADRAGAGEDNFLWLIAGGDALNAFVYSRGVFTGADWVMSSA
ncbi:MAG: M67 family metallopeptidase [Alphaproteobacteria bacterium]|nr:M67 family metallopeptidase [Alphaproteobacteria bacterium]